jgi:hypothetical protein
MPDLAALTVFWAGFHASEGWSGGLAGARVEMRAMILVKTIGFAVKLAVITMLSSVATTGLQSRTVHGKVTDANGNGLRGAVVQIKNTQSLWIRSFICHKDGSYHFVGLSLDIDYEVRASHRGRWSSTETVSRFDSKDVVEINLVVDIGTTTTSTSSALGKSDPLLLV